MKPFGYFLMLLLACTLVLGGCKKSDTGPIYQVSFTFNGNGYSMVNPTTYVNAEGVITAIGRTGDANVTIQFINARLGVVPIGAGGGAITFETAPSVDDAYVCNSGTITVTTLSSVIIGGTFDVMAIHNAGDTPLPVKGSFNIKLK